MTITFLGGGNMATAIAGGLIARGTSPDHLHVIEPQPEQRSRLAEHCPGIGLAPVADERVGRSELVVLAVKPQHLRDAVRPLLPFLGVSRAVVLSIAAGIRLADIGRWLDGYDRLVRAMPNTPALIGQGIAGLYAPATVDAAGRELAQRVLAACGAVVWVEREAMLDAVTAVSGSGPAYVFYFLEALDTAARELGFAPADARELAYATFAGAIALARSSDASAASLRAQVTSRGGTTERAIARMEARAVGSSIVEAVQAAAERARELGDAFGTDA